MLVEVDVEVELELELLLVLDEVEVLVEVVEVELDVEVQVSADSMIVTSVAMLRHFVNYYSCNKRCASQININIFGNI